MKKENNVNKKMNPFVDANGKPLTLDEVKKIVKDLTLEQALGQVYMTPKTSQSDRHAFLTAISAYQKMKNKAANHDTALGKVNSANETYEEEKARWETEKQNLQDKIKNLEGEVETLKKSKKSTAKPEEIKAKEDEIKDLRRELKKAQKELEKLQKAQTTGVPAGKPASKPTAAPAAPEADDYVRYITQANQTRLAGAYFDEQGKPWKLAEVQSLQEHCPTIWNQVAKWQPCAIDDNGNIVAQKAVSQSPDDIFKSMGKL